MDFPFTEVGKTIEKQVHVGEKSGLGPAKPQMPN